MAVADAAIHLGDEAAGGRICVPRPACHARRIRQMTHRAGNMRRIRLRDGVVAGAAALALGFAGPALAQPGAGVVQGPAGQQAQPSQAPSQQPGSPQPADIGELRTAEQALRQAHGQVSGALQPNYPQARTAVRDGIEALGRVPTRQQGQDEWRAAQRQMNEAQQALLAEQPDGQRIATQLRDAADSLAAFIQRVGTSADAAGASRGMSGDQTGATAATPAPAQSAGSPPQQTAASPAAGVPLRSVQDLIGTNVAGADGRDAGELRNLLIDSQGRVRAAVIEWGGFLGIGTREALVPIERIQLGRDGSDRAQLDMTREELEALPRYDRDRAAAYGRERGWGEGLRLHR